MKFKMAFKRVLLVAIMATTMFAMVACGDKPEGAPPQGNNEPPVSNEVDAPEQNDQEVVTEDGTYTGTENTLDEKGQIEVELTIVDTKIQDFKVIKQDGIEIDEATIESFKDHVINNKPLEGVTGDKDQIDLLMRASVAALNETV